MLYQYRFWESLFRPEALMNAQDGFEFRGYKKRVLFVLFMTVLLFILQNLWGMGTQSLTTIFSVNDFDTYAVARLLALLGSIAWALLFFLFHYVIMSYVLHLITDIPYRTVKRVQLFVISIILIEKFILLFAFFQAGFATNLSFLSLAPIFAEFTGEEFILFFVNQLSISTIIAIIIQYVFLSKSEEHSSNKILLTKLIILHIFIAAVIAFISISPFKEWIIRGLA